MTGHAIDLNAVNLWLKRKAASEAATGLLFAAGCLLLGGIVLVFTFFFTYAVVWFALNMGVSGFAELILGTRLHLSQAGVVAVSLMFLALLFWSNRRISREYLNTYPRREYPGAGSGWIGLPGALVSLLAYPGASTRMITDVLLTGPRLATIAWSNATKSGRLRRLDVEGCSRVLFVLVRQPGRVSFAELRALAELREPQKVFLQLRDLDGVVFLREEPSGLSLTSELRQELAGALFQPVRLASPASLEPKHPNLPPGTLYELLGVPPTASPEELEVAYRNWMTQTCAGRAAGSEDKSRGQADEQIKAVHAAYEAFLAKHKSEQPEETAQKIDGVWARYKRLQQ